MTRARIGPREKTTSGNIAGEFFLLIDFIVFTSTLCSITIPSTKRFSTPERYRVDLSFSLNIIVCSVASPPGSRAISGIQPFNNYIRPFIRVAFLRASLAGNDRIYQRVIVSVSDRIC